MLEPLWKTEHQLVFEISVLMQQLLLEGSFTSMFLYIGAVAISLVARDYQNNTPPLNVCLQFKQLSLLTQ